MLKKNEVIEILENGGHISLNDIYRTANVYSLGGENLGVCRYDTAERIGRSEGHTIRNMEAWSFTRRVEKIGVPEEMTAAAQEKPAAQAAPAPRYSYLVTIQERYSAEIRTIKVNALNEEHARIKARAQCNYSEFIAAVEIEPTGQEKTDRENREHCRRIAEDVNDYAEGRVYRCPDCGEILTLPDDVGDKYRCPDCGTVAEVDDLEQLGLYDYFADCLDIEYRVSGRARDALRSVSIMVACGGPNIYIDTASKQVELYWWGDRASYPINHEAAEQIDEWASELWSCQ